MLFVQAFTVVVVSRAWLVKVGNGQRNLCACAGS